MTLFQHLLSTCGHHCIFMVTPTLQESAAGAGILRHCLCPECHDGVKP